MASCALLLCSLFFAPSVVVASSSGFKDICFKQESLPGADLQGSSAVQKLMPYDSMLQSRQGTKLQAVGTFAAGDVGTLLKDPALMPKYVQFVEDSKAVGLESGCGMTASWLAELYLGTEGEAKLGFPGYTPVWGPDAYMGDNLTEYFRENSKKGDHRFYYLATNGNVTQHVWVIEQLPAAGDKPVRFRIMMSGWDAYTLTAWMEEKPEKDDLIARRHVYKPQGEPDSFFDKKEKLFEDTDVCVLEPEDDWPSLMRDWIKVMLDYSNDDAYDDFIKAQSKYGGGRLFTEEEFFGDDGYVTAMAKYTQKESDTCHTFPVKLYDQEISDLFVRIFGFRSIDQYIGVPMLTRLNAMRQLWDSGSATAAAKTEAAKQGSKLQTGFLITSRPVDEDKCVAHHEILSKSLDGAAPPTNGLADSVRLVRKQDVCGKTGSASAAIEQKSLGPKLDLHRHQASTASVALLIATSAAFVGICSALFAVSRGSYCLRAAGTHEEYESSDRSFSVSVAAQE